jgi:hypothetical protein
MRNDPLQLFPNRKSVLSGTLDQLAHTNLVLLTSDARNVTLLIKKYAEVSRFITLCCHGFDNLRELLANTTKLSVLT